MYSKLPPSGVGAVAHLQKPLSKVLLDTGKTRCLHAARHIVARRSQQVRMVWAPLQLPYRPFVPNEL